MYNLDHYNYELSPNFVIISLLIPMTRDIPEGSIGDGLSEAVLVLLLPGVSPGLDDAGDNLT